MQFDMELYLFIVKKIVQFRLQWLWLLVDHKNINKYSCVYSKEQE